MEEPGKGPTTMTTCGDYNQQGHGMPCPYKSDVAGAFITSSLSSR